MPPESPARGDPTSQMIDVENETTPQLTYPSGQPVQRYDLVVRLRSPESIQGGKNMFDDSDIFDGPFRILAATRTRKRHQSGRGPNSQEASAAAAEEIPALFLKLEFPPGATRADPWTAPSRLFPVFELTPEAKDHLASRTPFDPKVQHVINLPILPKPAGRGGDRLKGACYIEGKVFAEVPYYTPEEAEGSEGDYIVQKLRGKKIEWCPGAQYPNAPMDDPAIVDYLGKLRSPPRPLKLVVMYLVHWAGWPSEHDEYTCAKQKIDDEFIHAWRTRHPEEQDM
jgi:hypothetical protein